MEIDGATARWKKSGSAAVSMSRCRLRAARGQRGLPLCRASPHRDNEGWSTGKDVQSSLTVCVPSELRPVSSVTIQLLWPPTAPPLSSWSLCQPVTHNTLSQHTHTHTQIVTGIHANIYMCHANMHFVWGQGVLWNTLITVLIWQLSLRDSTIENHVFTFKIPFHRTIYAEDFTF